jgi:hypothetical protein
MAKLAGLPVRERMLLRWVVFRVSGSPWRADWLVALAGLAAWLVYHAQWSQHAQQLREVFLAVGRQ